MDRGAGRTPVHRVAKSQTRLNNLACMHAPKHGHTPAHAQAHIHKHRLTPTCRQYFSCHTCSPLSSKL